VRGIFKLYDCVLSTTFITRQLFYYQQRYLSHNLCDTYHITNVIHDPIEPIRMLLVIVRPRHKSKYDLNSPLWFSIVDETDSYLDLSGIFYSFVNLKELPAFPGILRAGNA
jgi:hypothetical protein